jgi:hypothetical protein
MIKVDCSVAIISIKYFSIGLQVMYLYFPDKPRSFLCNFIPVLVRVMGLPFLQTKILQVSQSWGTKRRWVLHEANDKHLVSIPGERGAASPGTRHTAFLGTSSEVLLKFNRVDSCADLFILEQSEYFTRYQLSYSMEQSSS